VSTTTCSARSRAARVGGFVGALVVGLAAAASASPGAFWSPLTATGCAVASSPHAGLVVDFGTVTDAGTAPHPTPQTACVSFGGAETGSQLLLDAGHALSFDPRSGLLCRIDGYPSGGCDLKTYWSYWHGGSKWTYSSVGPDTYRVPADGVEGWRFVSTASPPRSRAAGPCPRSTPTTTTRSAPSTTAPATGGSDAVSHAATGSTVALRGWTGSSTTQPSGPHTSATAGSGELVAGEGSSDTTGSTRALAAPAQPHRPGSGSPVGAIAVGLLVVALGVGAFVVTRMRSST
jgi:hypothetical protein